MNARIVPPPNTALDQAHRFLAKAVPWPNNGEGYVNIHWSERKPNEAKRVWSGRASRTLDEAMSVLNWITSQPGKREIYVCMSSQRTAQEKISKKGTKYLAPVRNQQNVNEIKSLYLDIDFKAGDHGYDNPPEAVAALKSFIKAVGLPVPSIVVKSGGGLHVHFCLSRVLTREEWQQLASALAEAGKRHGLKADWQVTVDSARLLRIPGTENNKQDVPRPVTLAGNRTGSDYTPERLWRVLEPYKVALPSQDSKQLQFEQPGATLAEVFKGIPLGDELSAGIEKHEYTPVHLDNLARECGFIRKAITTGGAAYNNPMWNLTTLIATFTDDPRNDAHRMGNQHPGYAKESTDEFFDRKVRERDEKGLGFPACATISGHGCTACQTCPHFADGRSPLAALPRKVTVQAEQPSYADPYADFVGPAFPASILPPVLKDLIEAEHQAMGADLSALAMALIAGVGAALTSETKVQVGDGWFERPIFWVALVGDPSTMKSPVIDKAVKAHRKIDHNRDAVWRQRKSAWNQSKAASKTNPGPPPAKPARCIIQDATPEKTAEILSRGSAGSLMVQDELAGWMANFDRYGSGASSRAFYLTAFNGGTYLKDRVGQGVRDDNAEIRVDNLALCILGGIQPDRLSGLRDLTSDGLLQRFLVVLMAPAKRGDQKHPVIAAEAQYAKLIQSVHSAPPSRYRFAPNAELVLARVLDRLYELEQVQGFPSALIGAIGKLKGYYARIALTLQVAAEHSATINGQSASAGGAISRQTAEAAEKLLFEFLLPHMFGLYDVIANGGQDRDTIRAIGDFILASDKDRLRPSDLTAGVRRLRNQPANKIAEWLSRFCALGWLRPEDDKAAMPKAWLVDPGLRACFAERREQAQRARAEAHRILKAGGTRR